MIIRSPGALPRALAAQGAELAFTYQGEALGKRVKPLAESLGAPLVLPCDVEDIASVDAAFASLGDKWGQPGFSGPLHRLHRQE
jgi:enoyl-[acyl-carrier protein] reductase I